MIMLLSKNKTSILTVSILSSLLITFAHLPANGAGTINLTTGTVQTSGNPATILSTTGILFTAGTTNASCNDGYESLSNLFDGNRNSKFCSISWSLSAIPNEVVLDFTDKVVNVTDVGLSTANDAPYRDPKSWDLLGSMDGLTWQLIKANTYDQTVLNSLSRNSDYPDVSVSNAAVFRFLKFIVNDVADFAATSGGDSGGPVVQYSELRLYGTTQDFPTISTFSPWYSNIAGGSEITISGSNFAPGATVSFGSAPASNVTVVNSNTIIATTGSNVAAANNYVNVTVTNPNGASKQVSGFFYSNSPTITTIDRTVGPTSGGTNVTFYGSSLYLVDSLSSVKLNGVSVLVNVYSSDYFTITTPAGAAGAIDVSVSTLGGSVTVPNAFTYFDQPSITSISPTSGTTLGGTSVIITGFNLASASLVTFGGNSGVVTSNNSSQIVVTSPSGSAGAAFLSVTTPGGTTTSAMSFTYISPTTSTNNRQSTNGSCSSSSSNATNKSSGRGSSQNSSAFCSSTSGPSR
jgi:hypothetical protein